MGIKAERVFSELSVSRGEVVVSAAVECHRVGVVRAGEDGRDRR
jgi:hypothetical protein